MRRRPAGLRRASAALNQAEEELRQQMFRLGQICYGQLRDAEQIPEVYRESVSLIRQSEQRRKDALRNKLRLEGKVMCESCGAELSLGSIFCSLCGKRLDAQEPLIPAVEKRNCPNCGQSVIAGAKFCVNCGQKLL